MSHTLGWLPDPPDDRDLDFARTPMMASAADVPDETWLGEQFAPVLDQGPLGACVAHAVAQVIYASHKRAGVKEPQLASRLAIYYLSRATHKMQHFDSGTFLRTAFGTLNKFGFAPETAWAYDLARFAVMPPFNTFRLAYDQSSGARPTVYWRIHSRGDERLVAVKSALAKGYPVAFGTLVTRSFVEGKNVEEPVAEPTEASDIVGGHAMVIGGHGPGYFHVLNSWGEDWGTDGWCQLSEEYIAGDVTTDLWVAQHAPNYVEDE